VSRQAIVELISNTTTRHGLTVRAALDTDTYATGIKVSDSELANVQLTRHEFHGDWNYTITPQKRKYS
jgi:Rhodopirellula transposase DDE domain